MFTSYPNYNPYRVLYDRSGSGLPLYRGEDVYALQKALNYFGAALTTDGILGPKTGAAIWKVQQILWKVQQILGFTGSQIDGKAGQLTQRALDLGILAGYVQPVSRFFRVGVGAMERESIFIVGNYSPQRPVNPNITPAVPGGDFDAGVVQRNSQFHKLADGFDPVDSIGLWVRHTTEAYSRFSDPSRFRDTGYEYPDWQRRWKLAGAAWNAPAFANYFAGVGNAAKPSAAAEVAFLDYVEGVGVYL